MSTQYSAQIFLYDQHIHIFPSQCMNTFKMTVAVEDGGTNTHEDGTSLDGLSSFQPHFLLHSSLAGPQQSMRLIDRTLTHCFAKN
jgi:hypothetical protein